MNRRKAADRGSPQYGFTVLEMVVSLAVISLALLLASRLLITAQSRLSHAGDQLVEPAGNLAVEQIRIDLRAASGIARPLIPGWSREALVLFGHPAGTVSYEKLGDELVRRVLPTDDEHERLVLTRVTTWRWRALGSSVEVDLRHRRLGHLRQQRISGRWQYPALPESRRLLRVTPRGSGSRTW